MKYRNFRLKILKKLSGTWLHPLHRKSKKLKCEVRIKSENNTKSKQNVL